MTSLKPAPKDVHENISYRRAILKQSVDSHAFQRECWIRASRDIVWWSDCWAYTFSPKEYPECPNRPFVLYDYQEDTVRKLVKAVGKHDMLIEKSRDMGASWMVLLVFTWMFLFRPQQAFLIGSRKQEYVDQTGDPDSLFWKSDYLISHLPKWMQPPIERNMMHMQNLLNGSVIDGESTNENFSAGGRRGAIMLDEFALAPSGQQILAATQDATNCRIFNSTPKGAFGAYFDTREKMMANTPERVIRLHWSTHPLKAPGLYTTSTGEASGEIKILDTEYEFPEGYSFIADGKLRSPWYDEQCIRSPSARQIAQELDIDYLASGGQYFDSQMLEKIRAEYAREPDHVGELILDPDWHSPKWEDHGGGRIKLWFKMPVDGKLPESWDDCVVGCDPASGKGGDMTSNSVASVARKSTGEKIAQFASNQTNPTDFAHIALGLCKLFNDAYLIWEDNGPPGGTFAKAVMDSKYGNIYWRNENEVKFTSRKTKKPGWHSTATNKPILLSDYFNGLIRGEFANPCEEAIRECGHYVQKGNAIEHSRALSTDDPYSMGESHGDMVIADSLAWRGMADVAKQEQDKGPAEPPIGSFAACRKDWERNTKRSVRPWGVWAKRG